MGKVCAVPGCNSGSIKDLRQKKIDGIRKCSTFRVPKDIQLRKIWSDNLGKLFSNTDRICELHFHDEDLYNEDDVTIIGGKKFVSVRERVTIKKNAIPRRDVVEEPEISKEEKSEFCVNKITRDYSSKLSQGSTEKLISSDKIECSNSVISQEIEGCDTNTSNYEDDARMDAEYGFDNEVANNGCNNISSQLSTVDKGFGIPNLVEILTKSHLRQNWSWGEKNGHIVFSLFNLNALTVRCYLQVHSDMTLTIFLCDKHKLVNFTGITLIESFEDLIQLLRRLEDQKLYLKTGLLQNGRSETCSIGNTFDRCSFCMEEKEKFKKHRLSIEDKYKPLVKKYSLLKRRSKYYTKRLKEARTLIAKLESELDNAGANAQKKLLEPLPSIQREIVGMFVKFASIEKNRIRYDSYDWICECLSIYKKSYSLYEYMRDRGILPLPSPRTLHTQQKTLSTALAEDLVVEQQEL